MGGQLWCLHVLLWHQLWLVCLLECLLWVKDCLQRQPLVFHLCLDGKLRYWLIFYGLFLIKESSLNLSFGPEDVLKSNGFKVWCMCHDSSAIILRLGNLTSTFFRFLFSFWCRGVKVVQTYWMLWGGKFAVQSYHMILFFAWHASIFRRIHIAVCILNLQHLFPVFEVLNWIQVFSCDKTFPFFFSTAGYL